MNNLQHNCVSSAHHIQLSFSENNELIVRSCSHATTLMHKLIISIENMHYLHVTQSNNEAELSHFNFQLRFYSKEPHLAKQYDWLDLTGVVDGKHIYTIKSNMAFTTNIDNISLNRKQNLKGKTDIYCLLADEHKVFYLNLNWIDRVETYLKNPIEPQTSPIYYFRIDNDGRTFSNIKNKPFVMFAKIIMKPLGSCGCATSFDVDILDVLTFYYQYRSKQVDVLSEQSKTLLFRLMEFLNKVPY